MAGGEGRRLRSICEEKPMLELGGKPIVEWVVESITQAKLKFIVATTSRTEVTRKYCSSQGWKVLKTPGMGWVADLGFVQEELGSEVLFLPADTPFLSAQTLRKLTMFHRERGPGFFCATLYEDYTKLGFEAESVVRKANLKLVPVGVTSPSEDREEVYLLSPVEAANLNTPRDVEAAKRLLPSVRTGALLMA